MSPATLVLNKGKRWANAQLNPEVPFACHALSIDEEHRSFQLCLWAERIGQSGQTIKEVWFADVGVITRNEANP